MKQLIFGVLFGIIVTYIYHNYTNISDKQYVLNNLSKGLEDLTLLEVVEIADHFNVLRHSERGIEILDKVAKQVVNNEHIMDDELKQHQQAKKEKEGKIEKTRKKIENDNNNIMCPARQEEEIKHINLNRCNIDQRNDLDEKTFINEYVMKRRPVIWKGALNKMKWSAKTNFQLNSISKMYGNSYLDFRDRKQPLKRVISRLLNAESLPVIARGNYIALDEHMLSDVPSMLNEYTIPKLFQSNEIFTRIVNFTKLILRPNHLKSPSMQYITLGASLSGTSTFQNHWNTDIWSAQVQGCRHWIIIPEETEKELETKLYTKWKHTDHGTFFGLIDPLTSPYKYMYDTKMEHYECTQEMNDIIYIPGKLYHTNLHLAPSVAITHSYVHFNHLNDIFNSICYTSHDYKIDSDIEHTYSYILSSIFMCVALKREYPVEFENSCCVSPQFRSHLDQHDDVVGYSQLDQISNSRLLTVLLKQVSNYENKSKHHT